MTGCDSTGSRLRRDRGFDFAPIVKDSSLDVGVSAKARSRRGPVGCCWSGKTGLAAAVLEAWPEDLHAGFLLDEMITAIGTWLRIAVTARNDELNQAELTPGWPTRVWRGRADHGFHPPISPLRHDQERAEESVS